MLSSQYVTYGALALALCLPVVNACAQQNPLPTLAQLRAGFVNPPAEARLRCYWWWLNGNTDKATITNDLEQMKAKGFGGALLVDANGADQEGNSPVPHGPDFGSPAWVELYKHALKEADRLGLEITLNITSGWNLGGPNVTPAQASKILTWSRTNAPADGVGGIWNLAMPPVKNGFYRQLAVLAYPLKHGTALARQPESRSDRDSDMILKSRSAAIEAGFSMPDTSAMLLPGKEPDFSDTDMSQVRDLTAQVGEDGVLHWKVPAGDWEVLRIGYTDSDARVSTGSQGWQGLAIDYLSRKSFESYWDDVVEPLLAAAKPYHSLKFLATDSWELKGTNWTDAFSAEFKSRRGYDPILWLPVVTGRVVGDRDQSTRFLTDLRRTVADLVSSQHYDVFAEKARVHGLGIQCESGGPHGAPIDALETFRSAGIVQTEFWSPSAHRSSDDSRFFTKEAASAGHIYGQHFIAEEGETSVGPQWSESLGKDLKPSFDMGITEGMNRLVWHEFTSSPASSGLPGQEYFAGTHVDPKVTWFEPGTAFFTYLNRGQYLMQQGLPVNDLLYFYGDNVPNFVRLKSDDPAHVQPGYDYDVTNEDALLHKIRIEGGKLTGPSGMQWKALALPSTGRLSLPVLQRVDAYVLAGGVVIGLPPASPTGVITPSDQTTYSTLVKNIWGSGCAGATSHTYGKGQVFCTRDSHAVFQAMKLSADLSLPPGEEAVMRAGSRSELDYVHQQIGEADLYYLRNGSDHISRHEVAFRASGSKVELWDAVTGEMLALPAPRVLADGRSAVTVELPAFGSGIVVFTKTASNTALLATGPTKTQELKTLGPWALTFQQGRGAPKNPIEMPELKDWTTSSDAGVRYFSGSATYRAKLIAPKGAPGKRIWIAFGNMHEIARVKINGQDAGTVWANPLRLRVDPFLKPGENKIEIEVTNLWPNRLIGDLQPGVTKRITSTNITLYKPDSPLLSSGLLGPLSWVLED